MAAIRAERVYRRSAPGRGTPVLVDRVWPRGIRKEDLGDVLWLRDIAPSDELRTWFGHRPERWPEFRARYLAELGEAPRRDLVDRLAELARRDGVTLLFGARDEDRNQAIVLRDLLLERLRG